MQQPRDTTNYKNILQEYCQQRKIHLPFYKTFAVSPTCKSDDDKDNKTANIVVEWKSEVTLTAPEAAASTSATTDILDSFLPITVTGRSATTKVAAQQSAAKVALEEIQSRSAELQNRADKSKLNTNAPTCIFVDAENCPLGTQHLEEKLGNGYRVYVFAATGHPTLARKYNEKLVEVVPVPSSRKDAVDLSISIWLGIMLALSKFEKFVVITKDHFGPAIPECVDENTKRQASQRKARTSHMVQHHLSAEQFIASEISWLQSRAP